MKKKQVTVVKRAALIKGGFMSFKELIESFTVIVSAIAILGLTVFITTIGIVGGTNFALEYLNKKNKEQRTEWIDEETRCFYQGDRLVNCETARGRE